MYTDIMHFNYVHITCTSILYMVVYIIHVRTLYMCNIMQSLSSNENNSPYITLPTVVSRLNIHVAVVAIIHKSVAALIVKFIEHGHC